MDKFKLLEQKLEDIITKLNKEIEAKQIEASKKTAIYNENNQKEEIESKIQDSKEDLEFLKIFENKNVFITAIKELNKFAWNSIKQAEKFEIFITTLLLLFLVILSIGEPLVGVVVLSLIAVFETIFACFANHEVKKVRKKHSIEELKSEIKSLEQALTKKKEQEKEENKELANLIFELHSLSDEKDAYLEKLKKVQEARSSVLEQIASVPTLNAMYDKSKIEETLNIRVREKKTEN